METSKQHLVLIGLMGSGKSSVGRHLSTLTGKPYFDTDRMIEAQMRKSIAKIFSLHGEPRFRELEHEMISKALLEPVPSIVSTGGGSIINAANRELIWQHGYVVYLQADANLLYERATRDHTRPLLHTENPLARITELLQARAPFYEQANLIISIKGKTIQQVSKEIFQHWPNQAH
jgi:shikimate kinase